MECTKDKKPLDDDSLFMSKYKASKATILDYYEAFIIKFSIEKALIVIDIGMYNTK